MMTQCRFYYKRNYANIIIMRSIYILLSILLFYSHLNFQHSAIPIYLAWSLLFSQVPPIGSKLDKIIGVWMRNTTLCRQMKAGVAWNVLCTPPPYIGKRNVCKISNKKMSIEIQKHLPVSHHACRGLSVHSRHDQRPWSERTTQVTPLTLTCHSNQGSSALRNNANIQQAFWKHSSASVLLTAGTATRPPTRHSGGEAVTETLPLQAVCMEMKQLNPNDYIGNLDVMAWIIGVKTHWLGIKVWLCVQVYWEMSLD